MHHIQFRALHDISTQEEDHEEEVRSTTHRSTDMVVSCQGGKSLPIHL